MPSDTTIREQVDTITRSGAMGSEDTALVKIFHYLVEEELAGRGDRLKAYSIALDVLNKSDSFDPASDSSVRVLMHRLRVALDLYNSSPSSANDAVKVTVPLQQYRPQFIEREVAEEQPAPAPAPEAPPQPKPAESATARGSVWKKWLPIGVVVAAIVAIAALLFTISGGSKVGEVAQLSPSVTVSFDNRDANAAALSIIEQTIDSDSDERFPIVIAEDGQGEYDLRLSVTDWNGTTKVLAVLYDGTERLIVSQMFDANALDDEQNLTRIGYLIDQQFLSSAGYVASNFADRTDVSPERLKIYNCFNASSLELIGQRKEDLAGDDLVECLDPDMLADPADKVMVLLLRARMMVKSAAGLLVAGKKYTADDARAQIAEAKKLTKDDVLLLGNELRLEWYAPDRTDARLWELVTKAQRVEVDPGLSLTIAMTYSYYLGEWEMAEKTAQYYLETLDGLSPADARLFNFVTVPERFLADDFEGALSGLEATGAQAHPTYAILNLAIGCAAGDADQISAGRRLVDQNPALSLSSLDNEVIGRHFAPNLQLGLLTALSAPGCDYVSETSMGK